MSMVLVLDTASPKAIQSLLANPDSIHDWVDFDPDDPTAKTSSDTSGDAAADARSQIDLDKAWHAIHFLLCGSADECAAPEGFLLSGGTPICDDESPDDFDLGYGPARAFTPDQVRAAATVLRNTPPELLRPRFDFAKLATNEIYPDIWDDADPNTIDYVMEYFDALRAHWLKAADKGLGMVVYLA
jgi:hypothetical protein